MYNYIYIYMYGWPLLVTLLRHSVCAVLDGGVSSESDSAPGVRSGQRGGNSKLLLYSGFGIKGLGFRA